MPMRMTWRPGREGPTLYDYPEARRPPAAPPAPPSAPTPVEPHRGAGPGRPRVVVEA